jgi:hypothetical protein
MAGYRRFKADRMKDIIKEFKISKATTYSGRRYNLFLFDYGYKANLLTLAKKLWICSSNLYFTNSPKKKADATYSGPPFVS